MTSASRSRPVILTFAGHYVPGYKAGGPIRTLVNIVDRLGDAFDFRIVTADRDLGDDKPFEGIQTGVWTWQGKARVFYKSPGIAAWLRLLESTESREPDLIYLNGIFSGRSSISPILHQRAGLLDKAPLLLAPRGEFSPGALSIKRWKKHVFISACRCLGLYQGIHFQASSLNEASDITRTLGPVSIHVAPDLTGRSSLNLGARPLREAHTPFRLVHLARISPIKNLLGAIAVLARLGNLPVAFDIYGVVEDAEYWSRCRAEIAKLPQNVRVRFLGPIKPNQVESVLSDYDAFLFPTLGENYGHAIREALSAGLPVLISDRTPWRGLEARSAGADLPLDDLELFAERIRIWAALPADRAQVMRAAARALGDDPAAAEAAVEANRRMFFTALHGRY